MWMPARDIVTIGASAGGLEALTSLVSGLPVNLAAAVFVVLHTVPRGSSFLPGILSSAGPLPAIHPKNDTPIEHGRIYVARPDFHMLVDKGKIRLTKGPRENRTRPAIDPLFRSASRAYGARVIGVVLSGMLDDGSSGLTAIKRRGGVAIVQDPDDAAFDSMPSSALRAVEADFRLPARQIASKIAELSTTPSGARVSTEARQGTAGVRDRGARHPHAGGRKPARSGVRSDVSGLQRRDLGNPRRRSAALPLPHRTRLLQPEHGGGAGGRDGERVMGGGAIAGGKSGAGVPAGRGCAGARARAAGGGLSSEGA